MNENGLYLYEIEMESDAHTSNGFCYKEIQTVARKYEPPQDWHLKVFNFLTHFFMKYDFVV